MRAPGLLVASDLDACLLDEQTYSWQAARPALLALRSRGALLVLASSKTRAEMRPLAQALGLEAPLIVENGGALVLPEGLLAAPPPAAVLEGGARVLGLGIPRSTLVVALAELAQETATEVRGFASLDASALAALTGLGLAQAEAALAREWDEPFAVTGTSDSQAIALAARRRGLRVSRGGRFFHLTGAHDKGLALARLLELLRADGQPKTTLAIGDSENDREMLRLAEHAIVIPRSQGPDPGLVAALPHAAVAREPGPRGWNQAVLEALARLGGAD